MLLKFIGADHSMGLRHGKVYEVEVFTLNGYIWVSWGSHGKTACPYSSPKTFAENWSSL